MGEPMARFGRPDSGHRVSMVGSGWVVVWQHWGQEGKTVELRALPGESEADVKDRFDRLMNETTEKIPATRCGLEVLEGLLQADLDSSLSRRALDTTAPDIRFTYKAKLCPQSYRHVDDFGSLVDGRMMCNLCGARFQEEHLTELPEHAWGKP